MVDPESGMSMRVLIALTLPCALAAAPAAAEPLERLLATPAITPLSQDAPLVYRHRRVTGDGNQERAIRLERHVARTSVVARLDGDDTRQLAEFRGTTGNPIALVFLDLVVSRISEATGGSPFYLRRRIREAARNDAGSRSAADGEPPTQEFVLRPFEGGEHARALGAYAGLELTFRLSDAAQGRFVVLRATAGDYAEEMLLDGAT
jgi:hypothetical protein